MKKRITRTAAAILVAVLLLPCQVGAVSAQKAVMIDAQTGRVLFEKSGLKL